MELRGGQFGLWNNGVQCAAKSFLFSTQLNSITVYFNNWTLCILPEHPALPIVRLPGPIKILNFESIPPIRFYQSKTANNSFSSKVSHENGKLWKLFQQIWTYANFQPRCCCLAVVVVSAAFVLFIQAFLFSTPGDSRWQRLKNLNERKICFGMKNKPQELFSRVPLGVYTSRCLWRFEVLCAHTSVARGMTTLAIYFRRR